MGAEGDEKSDEGNVPLSGVTADDGWAFSRRFSNISKSDIYNLLSARTTVKLSWLSAAHQK